MVCPAVRYGPISLWGLPSCSTALIALVACGGGGAAGTTAPAPDREATACEAPADLVMIGGDVRTMDPDHPKATALAVRDGAIVAVGSDAEIRAYIGADTRYLPLDGRTVTPGLIDAHAHLFGLGSAMETVSLRDLDSEEAAARAVADAAAQMPAGEWVTGRGWDQTLWAGQAFPTRASLDAVVADRPVAVRRVDGHALWANSVAIELAGVTKRTVNPKGGKIVRDKRGVPTGVFVDSAMNLIESKIPAPSADVRRRRILAAARVAVAQGLTAVHEMGIDDETIAVYRELAADGELPLRIYALLSYYGGFIADLPERKRYLDDSTAGMFTLRAVKAYADGALGSRGAALLEPYSDDPGNRGLMVVEPDELARIADAAAANGWQLAVHAIGDRGNRAALDAFETAQAAHPDAAPRFRVEHAQVLALDDIPRFAALGVIASMQPTHCTSDMRWAEARVGSERILGAYAWRRLLDANARLAAGSDFPVEGVSPLLGVYAAVTRQDAAGSPKGGWYPDQRLELDEALRLFTADAAYAEFAEARRGWLAPGMLADITVFDRTLAPDRTLLEATVEATVVGGRVVHNSSWAQGKLAATAPSDVLCR
jgi:hypothetical protein